MNWEQRLREIVLAGGALAAAACQGREVGSSDASSDAKNENVGVNFCCNANGDPCCPFLYCGAPISPACACRLDGGTWNYSTGGLCSFDEEAGPSDAGVVPSDAGVVSSDASSDVMSEDVGVPLFCCNANWDPCCPFLNCNAPMSPACGCKLDGGTWAYVGPPGEIVCSLPQDAGSFPQEAGPGDAGSDGDGQD